MQNLLKRLRIFLKKKFEWQSDKLQIEYAQAERLRAFAEQKVLDANLYGYLKREFDAGRIPPIGNTVEGYQELKQLWRNSHMFIRYPFPMFALRTMEDGVTVQGVLNEEALALSTFHGSVIRVFAATGKFIHVHTGDSNEKVQ